jgi:F-type H+-transporting ATPase subunit delta
MKNDRLLAARYGEALSSAVPDLQSLATAWDDMRALVSLVGRSEELRKVLSSPAIAADAKARALHAIGARLGMRTHALHLVGVLARHGRLGLLNEVAKAVGALVDRRSGIVEVEISTAEALDEATRGRLVAALERAAGRKVRAIEHVDPALIGGVVARVGATIYDGSLKTKLEKMRSRLAG